MVNLKITGRYCLALYCLTMLYTSLHELVHHFAGYLVCGDWGYKTFNSFSTACEHLPKTYIATYAGPLFSFIMMYVGMAYLKPAHSVFKRQLGFALIFTQMPAQRMAGPILGFNDELYATSRLFGASAINQWVVTILIFAICIPPLVKAFQSIQNRNQLTWFMLYFLLLPYVLFGPPFVIMEYLMVEKQFLDQTVIEIGLLFVINEVVTILLFFRTKRYLDPLYKK